MWNREDRVNRPITPEELERALREFGGALSDISVVPVSTNIFVPAHLVKLKGGCRIGDNGYLFETEFNLREIGGASDVMRLADLLLSAFSEASDKGLGRPA